MSDVKFGGRANIKSVLSIDFIKKAHELVDNHYKWLKSEGCVYFTIEIKNKKLIFSGEKKEEEEK